MKVFISWSGDRSRTVAEALQALLQDVILDIDVWVSSRDLPPGRVWFQELSHALRGAGFGILCLTPGNIAAPWILFEAGALMTAFGEGRVCPFLIGLQSHQLSLPLSTFQSVISNVEGTLHLLRTINEACDSRVTDDLLMRRFRKSWPSLEASLDRPEVLDRKDSPNVMDQVQQILSEFHHKQEQTFEHFMLRHEEALHQGFCEHDRILWCKMEALQRLFERLSTYSQTSYDEPSEAVTHQTRSVEHSLNSRMSEVFQRLNELVHTNKEEDVRRLQAKITEDLES